MMGVIMVVVVDVTFKSAPLNNMGFCQQCNCVQTGQIYTIGWWQIAYTALVYWYNNHPDPTLNHQIFST